MIYISTILPVVLCSLRTYCTCINSALCGRFCGSGYGGCVYVVFARLSFLYGSGHLLANEPIHIYSAPCTWYPHIYTVNTLRPFVRIVQYSLNNLLSAKPTRALPYMHTCMHTYVRTQRLSSFAAICIMRLPSIYRSTMGAGADEHHVRCALASPSLVGL